MAIINVNILNGKVLPIVKAEITDKENKEQMVFCFNLAAGQRVDLAIKYNGYNGLKAKIVC